MHEKASRSTAVLKAGEMAGIPFLVDFSPPTLLVPLALLAQVLVRAGTVGWIGSAVEEALRSVA
jgi:hypothetical protein